MSFRQFGGLQYAARNNIVSSNYNTNNNLQVTQNVGQSSSYINCLSDLSGNFIGNATTATTATTATNLSGGNAGTVPYQSGTGTTSFTSAGASGQVLTSNGVGAPTWTTPSGTTQWNSVSGGISNGIYYNGGNVGIGQNNPGSTLDVSGNLNVDGFMNGVINNPGFNFLQLDISNNFAQTWTLTSDTSYNWTSIAMSASGQYQTATVNTANSPTPTPSLNYIYTSNNYGVTWTQNTSAPSAYWNSVAISASGQYQTAVENNPGYIHTSRDYGVTWTQNTSAPSAYWTSVAISASGQYQISSYEIGDPPNNTGYIYTSNDYGVTWTQNTSAPSDYWTSVAISASGQYQTAVASNVSPGGFIYTSIDYGVFWSKNNSAPFSFWENVTMSASGQYQTATGSNNNITNNYIYTSTNYGSTWNPTYSSPSTSFFCIAMSASGQYQIAGNVSINQNSYYSTNYGNSWLMNSSANGWQSVAISASGQYQSAVIQGGIYTSEVPSSTLNVNGIAPISVNSSSSISFGGTQIFNFVNGIQSITGPGYPLSIYNPGSGLPQYLYANTSSIKYKENVLPLEDDRYNIQNFMKLKPIKYNKKNSTKTEVGFIAEDIDELGFNELVFYVDNECEYVYYERLSSFIVKIVQEQQKKIEELEDKISSNDIGLNSGTIGATGGMTLTPGSDGLSITSQVKLPQTSGSVNYVNTSGNNYRLVVDCDGFSTGFFQITFDAGVIGSPDWTLTKVTVNNAVNGGHYVVYITASLTDLIVNSTNLTPSSVSYTNITDFTTNVTIDFKGRMEINTSGIYNFISCRAYA